MNEIRQGATLVRFNGTASTLSLPGFELQGCQTRLLSANETEHPLCWKLAKATDAKLLYKCENELGAWTLEFSLRNFYGGLPGIEIAFGGVLKKPVPELTLVSLQVPELECSHALSQGAMMGRCQAHSLPKADAVNLKGHHQLMLSRPGSHLQMSFPLRQAQPAHFQFEIKGSAVRGLRAEAIASHFGGMEVKAPALRLVSSPNGFSVMEAWAEENSELKKDFSQAVACGWNSWDYYRWTITEKEVLENAEFIARDPVLSKHVKRIVVDDGWQYCYGEWEANPLFPNGMEYLAKELTKMGFEPGLWFAPTIMEPHSRIAQLDYDMLALGESGMPCLAFECLRRHGFVLDPTQEKVKRYLRELFARYADMGYKYFKLDFMGATLNARRFADASVPRSEIARLIVEPIHEAVKGKATILGCNYLFEGGSKYVDAVRIGSDIHAKWSNLTHNVPSVAARFWSNKRLWINDPDFAICRGFDTSDDPDLTKLRPCFVFISPEKSVLEENWTKTLVDLSRPQLELLLSIALAAGGSVNLSDKMTRLNESGLDLARRTVSAESGEAAIPLDLFESDKPSFWLQKLAKGHRVLLVNWTDEAAERCFDLNAHDMQAKSAVNFWNDSPVAIVDGQIKAKLEPRSCLLAVIEE